MWRQNKMKTEFTTKYDIETIEYNFKFYKTDEREMMKQIINILVERISTLKLHKDKIQEVRN